MEDPFSVLNVLAPESLSRPQVTALYPPPSTSTFTTTTTDGSRPQSQMSQPRIHVSIPITTPSDRPIPVLSTLSNILAQPTPVASTSAPSTHPPKKRRHWTIVRNAPARSRAKDKEADPSVDDTKTTWKVPRDARSTDYGTFATFLGELAASAASPHACGMVGGAGTSAAAYLYGSEPQLFATIRSTVEHLGLKRKREAKEDEPDVKDEIFWTDERAEDGWDYLRDVVYGGVDGYAYVRSLAEFVAPSVYLNAVRKDTDADEDKASDDDGRRDVTEEADVKPPRTPPEEKPDEAFPLGAPLARYVEDNLVDMVTRGRHGWLRDVFLPAAAAAIGPAGVPFPFRHDSSASLFHTRMAELPSAARAVAAFKAWSEEQLDMATLIRQPEELAKVGILEGGPGGGEHAEIERALMWGVGMIEELGAQVNKAVSGGTDGADGDVAVKEEAVEDGPIAEEQEADAIAMDVDPDANSSQSPSQSPSPSPPKTEPDADTEEDPLVKRLRMNLLALAKRAPMDRIAKLPVELVPENIRGIVPTA